MKKYLFLCLATTFFTLALKAQNNSLFPLLDKSPMDMISFPDISEYYAKPNGITENRKIKVVYSRPKKNGRKVFGGIVPYGKEWRLGANEVTTISFNQEVAIEGQFINYGSYGMFAEIYKDHWVVILSKERLVYGGKHRDRSKDVARFKVPVEKMNQVREYFTMGFKQVDQYTAQLFFEWEQTRASLLIKLNPVFMRPVDASPIDMAYYPSQIGNKQLLKNSELTFKLYYARPQLKGRKIFGGLLPYGKLWRLGANEFNELTLYKDVKVGGKKLHAYNRYGIIAVPYKEYWEIIFHTNVPATGFYNYDKSKHEVLRIKVSTELSKAKIEALSMVFQKKNVQGVELVIGWENTIVRVPMTIL